MRNSLARLAFFVSVTAALLVPATVSAAWPDISKPATVAKTGANDVAVIVAVDDYMLLPDVEGAVRNANDWEVFLRQSVGVPVVHVLANQNVTRESMLKFARIAANDVGKDGRIWWVFIGHGAPSIDGKDGLLVGMDAQQTAESLQARSVRQTELLSTLESERHDVVAVFDACFSGRSADGDALAKGVQPVIAVDAIPRLGASSVVLSAAKPTEVAGRLPGARRPAFSYLVLGAMRGWADDGDGTVTANEVLYFTRRELRGVKGRTQTPQLEGNSNKELSKDASESRPDVDPDAVAEADPDPTPDPDVNRPKSDSASKAERLVTYLSRRVTYDGSSFRQNGRVLDPIPFYHAVERPDLAGDFRGHTPWMWGSGAALGLGGIALMTWGFSGIDSTGRFLGGTMGGFFAFGGGLALLVIGIIRDQHPVSIHERESLASEYNQKVREQLGLGPEDDPPVERRNSGGWNPFSMAPAPEPQFGVTFSF
jgi:hypothetical protein